MLRDDAFAHWLKKSKKYDNQLNDAVQRILTHKGNAKGKSKLAVISFPVLEYEEIIRKSNYGNG